MNSNTSNIRPALLLALVTTTAAFFAAPATAANQIRSNYQNAGGVCHAASPRDEFSMERRPSGYLNTGASGDDDDLRVSKSTGYQNKSLTTSNTSSSGSGNVVVICDLLGDTYGVGNPNRLYPIKQVQIYARNTLTNSAITMSCTITAGYATSGTTVTSTKSAILPTSGDQRMFGWSSVDHVPSNYDLPAPVSVMCSVPVGVELNDTVVIYLSNVGN